MTSLINFTNVPTYFKPKLFLVKDPHYAIIQRRLHNNRGMFRSYNFICSYRYVLYTYRNTKNMTTLYTYYFFLPNWKH